ncbi:MAG: hypothetical protein ABW208_11340 [Pyrinomonadaceae bacterium]
MGNRKSSQIACGRSSNVSVLRILGGAVLVLAAVGVISQFHDIRRYWNMVRM